MQANYSKCNYIDCIFGVIAFFILLFFAPTVMQAQKSDNYSFYVGNKTIVMTGNGDVLSSIDYQSGRNANNKNIRVTSSNNAISIGDNRNISIWEGNNYPAVFYFPRDKYLLLRDYSSNKTSLDALDKIVNDRQITKNIDMIEIVGACSPIGNEEHNMILALSRCMAMRSYLRWKYLKFAEKFHIKFDIVGVDRTGYRILKNEKTPQGEEQIWDMLQYTAIRFKMKDGSRVIPYSNKPKTFSGNSQKTSPAATKKKVQTATNNKKKNFSTPTMPERYVYNIHDTVFLKSDTVYIHTNEFINISTPLYAALKTNLLYDAALLPNLTAEWYIGRKWSFAVEGNWSWWTFDKETRNKQWRHRIQTVGIELRKWVYSPYPLQGHALGFYSMIGNYDVRFFVENEYTKGWLSYQSWSAGLSYAYSLPIARRFNLEFGLALGYVGGKYYRYDYCTTHDHWAPRAIFNRNYIGPTRIGISLVWRLGAGNDAESKNNFHAREKLKYQQLFGLQNK